MNFERDALRHTLESIVTRATATLRAQRGRHARAEAINRALAASLAVPAGVLLVAGGAALTGHAPPVGWIVAMLGAVIVPLLIVIAAGVRAARAPVRRNEAMSAADEDVEGADRLLAADEFLRRDDANGFMLAAIADAAPYVERAAARTLPVTDVPWHVRRSAFACAALALVVIGVIANLTPPRGDRSMLDDVAPERVARLDAPPRRAATNGTTAPPPETVTPFTPDATTRPASRSRGRTVAVRQDLPDQTPESAGRLGAGQASEAESSGSPSSARGAPESEGQPAKPTDSKTPKTTKKPATPKPADDRDSTAPKPPEPEPAGTTAGQGASRGSKRNSAVSDWSSRDQVATPDDEGETDEDDVEDEDESEDARGGVQPSLRDRRPPVNRDLRIGFGNRKSPDANGRGGPSAQKKSRGVASLVLGVPIPDRVKGQPNPGRTRITQQRIEPTPEDADVVDAQPRAPRSGPIGPLRAPNLDAAWSRSLLRSFFLLRRAEADATPTSASSAPSNEKDRS